MTGATTPVQTKRKTKVGRVVSDKMDKTIVVSVLSRAGEERAGEEIPAEEAATTEAIHSAAHPGRQAADEEGDA